MQSSSALVNAKIHFLIPWTGPLPAYTALFLKSCAANPGIEVTLIIDQEPTLSFPDNVHWALRSRAQIAQRVNACFGLEFSTIGGHKLCDFKPHYGLIFDDFIRGNPWWGFCDIDLMFGDLQSWIDATLTSDQEVVTVHDRIVAGHFTAVRNDPTLIRKIGSMVRHPKWEAAFRNSTCQMLDEYPFLQYIQSEGINLKMAPPLEQCLRQGFAPYGITFRFDGSTAELLERQFGFAVWHQGRIYYRSASQPPVEVLYLHFMGTKRWWHWLWPINPDQPIHSFSALGYGFPVPRNALQWQLFHLLRLSTQAAESVRQAAGSLIRQWLGLQTFLQIRRALISRHRY